MNSSVEQKVPVARARFSSHFLFIDQWIGSWYITEGKMWQGKNHTGLSFAGTVLPFR